MIIVKTFQKDDIPTKVIKTNKNIFAGFIANDLNNCANKDVFSDDLTYADVASAHKMKVIKPITCL